MVGSIRWCLVLFVGAALYADIPTTPIKTLDDAMLRAAQETVKKDFDALYMQRRRVTACMATAAVAVGAVCAYRWLQGSPTVQPQLDAQTLEHIQNLVQNSSQPQREGVQAAQVPLVQERGWVANARQWFQNGFSNSSSTLPGQSGGGFLKTTLTRAGQGLWGLSKLLVLPLALNGIAQFAMDRTMRFYRPLDWTWLLSSRTHLVTYFDQLNAAAAVLDTHSKLFDACLNITINSDQSVSTRGETQVWPMGSLDEIVRLRGIAQRGDVAGFDPALHEGNLVRLWNAYIDALAYTIAFVHYGMLLHRDASYFDKNQARTFIDDVIAHTRLLGGQLPELLAACATKRSLSPSAGLLACIHEYTQTIQRLCSGLEFNEIVQG